MRSNVVFLLAYFCVPSGGSWISGVQGSLNGGDSFRRRGACRPLPQEVGPGSRLLQASPSWEDGAKCFPAFQPRLLLPAILGKGNASLTTLSPEKRCQCQRRPLGNVIKADEKRAVDVFMSLEYSAWRFYGDHRKPERQ